MPPRGFTKKSIRACLVCATANGTAHMGIDLCRACSVFYRRSVSDGAWLLCRSNTNDCAAGRGLNCKKCRLRHIRQALKQCGASAQASKGRVSREKSSEADNRIPELLQHTSSTSSASPSTFSFADAQEHPRPLISKARAAYEKMSFARLMGELFSRKDQSLPVRISSQYHTVFPATFATLNHANRLLTSCVMEFGACCFPEFDELSNDEQLSVAARFLNTFRIFDNSYRAAKAFPNMPNRSFGGYTLWLSEDIGGHFFDDFDHHKDDLEDAMKTIAQISSRKTVFGRRIIEKVNPEEVEFLAVAILMFWPTNDVNTTDELTMISKNYRQQVYNELQSYYREVNHEEHAARLEELHALIFLFETPVGDVRSPPPAASAILDLRE